MSRRFFAPWSLVADLEARLADAKDAAKAQESLLREQLEVERQRVADWKEVAVRTSAELHDMMEKYHALATDPPTGLVKGPTLIDPLEGFPEKTKAAIRDVTKGRPRDIQDTIIKKARKLLTTLEKVAENQDAADAALAERVRRGEYSG